MKNYVIAAIAAGFLVSTSAAMAGTYLQVSAGATVEPSLNWNGTDYSMNTGYNVGGSLGTDLGNFFLGPRWDVREDVLYTFNGYSGFPSHLSGLSFMSNLLYHVNLGSPVDLYLGGGIGGVDVRYAFSGGNHGSDVVFGGQALAGLAYPITSNISLFGEYRFLDANDASFSFASPVSYQSHNFTLGLKLNL